MVNRLLYFLPFLLCLFGTKIMAQTPVVHQSLVFPLQHQHVHGSSLVELPNGDMLIAWFEGSGERSADDVRIMGARLNKGQTVWSDPFELADTPYLPDCNPVLFMVDQKLFLVWIAVQANRWENSILRVRTTTHYNEEGAPVWEWQDNILLKPDDSFAEHVSTKLKELPPLTAGWAEYAPRYDVLINTASENPTKRSMGWMTRIKPLVGADGRILLPLYSDGLNLSLIAISEDGGSSWLPSNPVVGRGNIQPALVQRKDGSIVAYMRDSGDAPNRVQVSESHDGGVNWSVAQKNEFPSGASVEALVLADGRWVMLFNDVEDGRYRISLYVSEDEGETWPVRYAVENDEANSGRFSYPSLIQAKDGMIHLSYSYHLASESKSIKHVVVNPSQLF